MSLAVVKRVPANVVGDGKHSVRDLIKRKNKERKENPFLSNGLIKVDREVLSRLRLEGLSLGDVVESGRKVYLRTKANASAGGDVFDVTDQVPDALKVSAVKAVSSIPGLWQGGVDVLFDEKTEGFSVIEINSRAQIGVNMYPTDGVGRDVPKGIIDACFPSSKSYRSKFMKRYSFNPIEVIRAFDSRVVKEVKLSGPIHGDNSRLYSCSLALDGCGSSVGAIKKGAEKFNVNGSFVVNFGAGFLYVCAERESMQSFIGFIKNIDGITVRVEKKWLGVVRQGFVVDRDS